ncbi:MAG: ArsA-related P-loop ATPase [Pseudomonadota bacterium]
MTRVLICCGAGGVGKTTLSAALGVHLARQGRRVAVLTIDPARRLADSLGLDDLGDEPRRIHLETSCGAGEGCLSALVLDVKATFDRLVRRFSPTQGAAARILENRYYHFAATRLTGTHEYMALERLHELVESELYDAVVLDTPPTRHALEFLTAPDRLARFLDHRVLRILALPRSVQGRERLAERSGRVVGVLDRLVGSNTLREIAEFIAFLDDLTDAISERVGAVREALGGARFYLVTTPVPAAQLEALAFLQELLERDLPFHGYLVNRCTPRPSRAGAPPLPEGGLARPEGLDPPTWDHILGAVAGAPARFDALAEADLAALEQLRQAAGPDARLWTIPSLPEEAGDLEALEALGPHLPGWEDQAISS